ncbi:MAG: hypothetical protein Q7R66_13440 [Undibacterium sp.]|nr:hypothetical protein [Undibacterium sp.]
MKFKKSNDLAVVNFMPINNNKNFSAEVEKLSAIIRANFLILSKNANAELKHRPAVFKKLQCYRRLGRL